MTMRLSNFAFCKGYGHGMSLLSVFWLDWLIQPCICHLSWLPSILPSFNAIFDPTHNPTRQFNVRVDVSNPINTWVQCSLTSQPDRIKSGFDLRFSKPRNPTWFIATPSCGCMYMREERIFGSSLINPLGILFYFCCLDWDWTSSLNPIKLIKQELSRLKSNARKRVRGHSCKKGIGGQVI